jgi:hypothetical protein
MNINWAESDEGADGSLVPYGWAPGGYWMRSCPGCGEEYDGAKRCSRCQKCALLIWYREEIKLTNRMTRGCETERLSFSGDSGETEVWVLQPARRDPN